MPSCSLRVTAHGYEQHTTVALFKIKNRLTKFQLEPSLEMNIWLNLTIHYDWAYTVSFHFCLVYSIKQRKWKLFGPSFTANSYEYLRFY